MFVVFFFKQKTAYEVRISDWSSDVCSSDLEAVAIGFAAPVFVVALSVPLLGERVGPRRWTAVLVGFAGVMIMLQPGPDLFRSIALVPLLGTVFFAVTMIVLRKLGRTETSASVAFTFTLSCTLISGFALPFVWISPDILDRKSTRLNSSHSCAHRMPSSA